MTYQPGDIIFVRHRNIISKLIRHAIHCDYNHVGVFGSSTDIIESTFKGVQLSQKDKFIEGIKTGVVERVQVGRITGLTEQQARTASVFAASKVGARYDFPQLFALLLVIILHISRRLEPVMDVKNAWVCSELLSTALYGAGIRMYENIDPSVITPADLYYWDRVEIIDTWDKSSVTP